MTPRQKVIALAADIGATVETEKDDSSYTVRVESPKGTRWSEGVHQLVLWQFSGFDTKELWVDAFDRMSAGFNACDGNCEWWV